MIHGMYGEIRVKNLKKVVEERKLEGVNARERE